MVAHGVRGFFREDRPASVLVLPTIPGGRVTFSCLPQARLVAFSKESSLNRLPLGIPASPSAARRRLRPLRAAPSGCSSAHSPPPKGNPNNQKRGLPGRRSRLLALFASARRSALLLRVPVSAGGRRPEPPAGARARRARGRRQRMDALSANPGRRPRTRRAGRPAGGAVG